MKTLSLFLGLLLSQAALAQTHQIDSLKRGLAQVRRQATPATADSLALPYLDELMRAYSFIQIDSSLAYNSRVMQLHQRHKNNMGLLGTSVYTAYLYRLKGQNFDGILWLYKALVIAEHTHQNTSIGYIYYSIAHAYVELGDYKKSMSFCEKGLAWIRKYPSLMTEVNILNIYGENYRQQKKYSQALQQYKKMYALANSEKMTFEEAQSLHAIGIVYQEIGQLSKAILYYEKALPLAKKTNDFDLEGHILLDFSKLRMKQRQWSTALIYTLMVVRKSRQIHDMVLLSDAQNQLHDIYKNTGKPDKALAVYEQYITLKDSLSRQTNQIRLDGLQARYDNIQKENTVKKQQVQLLLEQKNSQQLASARNGLFFGIFSIIIVAGLLLWNNQRLMAKNKQISEQSTLLANAQTELANLNQSLEVKVAERTRELSNANTELIQKNEEIRVALFKGQTIERKRVAIELHDNLSSLLSAINFSIQGINPKGLPEREQVVYRNIRHMITNAYAEVRNISHNILPAELEQAGLYNALTGMITKLNQNTPVRFTLETNFTEPRLSTEIEFNLYSISLELINNVIRHAQATEAAVCLTRTVKGVGLSVIDNGKGFVSSPKPGVGLQNIQSRLDALGGTCQIAANQPVGTAIHVEIPVWG